MQRAAEVKMWGYFARSCLIEAMKNSAAEQRQPGDHRQDMDRSGVPLQRQAHHLYLRQWKRKELKEQRYSSYSTPGQWASSTWNGIKEAEGNRYTGIHQVPEFSSLSIWIQAARNVMTAASEIGFSHSCSFLVSPSTCRAIAVMDFSSRHIIHDQG